MIAGSAAAQAVDLIPDFFKSSSDGRVIWEGNDQYVSLVPQDRAAQGDVPPNDHPVTLEAETLAKVFTTLTLWKEGGFLDSGDQTMALFSASQASLLGRKLAEAFALAGPGEDVTFAVMGLAPKLIVARDRLSTAGRAFYQGGKLNLIIGDMQRMYQYGKEKDITGIQQDIDRRVYPHNPGRRAKAMDHPAKIMNTEGVAYHTSGDELRGDWLVIDIKRALAEAEKRLVPEEVQKETRKVREEAAKLAIERRQMREELARMRKQMDDMSAAGGGGVAAESVESRLAKLDALHAKNLISDQEYASRRKAILDEI
jgi:hypothetical protein